MGKYFFRFFKYLGRYLPPVHCITWHLTDTIGSVSHVWLAGSVQLSTVLSGTSIIQLVTGSVHCNYRIFIDVIQESVYYTVNLEFKVITRNVCLSISVSWCQFDRPVLTLDYGCTTLLYKWLLPCQEVKTKQPLEFNSIISYFQSYFLCCIYHWFSS